MSSTPTSASPLSAHPLLAADALAATLARLVAINSVNPAHDGPAGGERAVLEACAAFLATHGVAAELLPCPGDFHALHAHLPGADPAAAPLLFETHVDTVSAAGMSVEPFVGTVREGRLYGRGSVDAKGQVVAMLHAFAAWGQLARAGHLPPHPAELLLVMDEEYNFGGVNAWLQRLHPRRPRAAGIVIGEPTRLRIVTTHKGTVRWRVELHGVAAHGARPHLGQSAIEAAAVLVDEIRTRLVPALDTRRTALLDPPTINFGTIRGGTQINLVADHAELHLDRRLLPGETEEAARRELEALFEPCRLRLPSFRATLHPAYFAGLPVETAADVPLVRAAQAVARAQGLDPAPLGVDYATDACVLAATGLPILVCGPGSIDQAHTADEYIELDQLERGARFHAALLAQPPAATPLESAAS